MASTGGIAALKALLAKQEYSEKLSTLSDIKTFVKACYLSLELRSSRLRTTTKARVAGWAIVCSTRGPPVPERVACEGSAYNGILNIVHLIDSVQYTILYCGHMLLPSQPPQFTYALLRISTYFRELNFCVKFNFPGTIYLPSMVRGPDKICGY